MPTSITATEQRELARSYQTARRVNDPRAPQYLAELVDSVQGLVVLIVREHHDPRGNDWEDWASEANLAVVAAVQQYGPATGGEFAGYVGGAVRNALRKLKLTSTGPSVPSLWVRAAPIAHVARHVLGTKLGRQPTDDELRAEVTRRAYEWAHERLTEAERTLPATEQREVMSAKLRLQGTLGAIEKLADVRAAMRPAAWLDAPVGSEPGGVTLGEALGGVGDHADLVAEDDSRRRLAAVVDVVRATA